MARDKVCVVIGAGDATGGTIARCFIGATANLRGGRGFSALLADPPAEAVGLDLRDGPQAVEGDVVTQ
jgi:hypothetical protein